jgi:uncharacterized protein
MARGVPDQGRFTAVSALGLEALSEAEIEQLGERLAGNRNQDALSLEGVDGLFCALIASPESVLPSEYLPVILGGESANTQAFTDIEDANATMSLLMRYWNSIIADFERESIHLPFLVEPGIDGIPGRAWARGFLKGTRLAPEGWSDLWDSEGDGQLLSIPLIAGELDPTWPTEPLTKEKEGELLQWMFAGAARAYRHFSDARREFADALYDDELEEEEVDDYYYPETYVRPEPKVGRNEPCPCGSGKKFKKCCGAADLGPNH